MKEGINMNEINKLFEIAEELENIIGTDELLLSLLKQMDIDELRNTLEFIDRMYDTSLFEEL